MAKSTSRPQKRTTVRMIYATLPKALAAATQLSPRLAGEAAALGFFRTARIPVRGEDAAVLAEGSPRSFAFPGGHLTGWSWGEGPTVLLVHGWNGRAAQLAPLVRPLVARGMRVLAYDGPGHGASSGSSTSVVRMAAAVQAVAAEVGDVAAVIAHSLGTVAAVRALGMGLAIERAVFLAPTIDGGRWLTTYADAIGLPEAGRPHLRAAIESSAGVPVDALDPRIVAASTRVPALIVHDRADREVPFAEGLALAEAWPRSVLHATDGLGHVRILREPHVTERVAAFAAGAGIAQAELRPVA